MNKLSKDYRLVILSAFVGAVIALFLINFSTITSKFNFWELTSYMAAATVFLLVLYMYRLSMKFVKANRKG